MKRFYGRKSIALRLKIGKPTEIAGLPRNERKRAETGKVAEADLGQLYTSRSAGIKYFEALLAMARGELSIIQLHKMRGIPGILVLRHKEEWPFK